MLAVRNTPKYSAWTYIPNFDIIEHKKRKIYLKFTGNDHDWDIFEACAISMKAQKEISQSGLVKTLTYGEINFESIARIIYIIKFDYGGINRGISNHYVISSCLINMHVGGEMFYDLGSGTGKAALSAAIVHPFKICCGVEILPDLHNIALDLKQKWDEYLSSKQLVASSLEYVCGSFFSKMDCDWTKGDVVFVNSHCLTDDMMLQLSIMAGNQK